MAKVIECLGENISVSMRLHGACPRRAGGGIDYAAVLGAIQDEFRHITEIAISARNLIEFSVLPVKGDSLESISDRCAALQELCIERGILAETRLARLSHVQPRLDQASPSALPG